jgi:hypothetical protein
MRKLDDYHIQKCLNRLGQIDATRLIDLIERRISSLQGRLRVDSHYEAIPFDFSEALASVRSNPEYPVVLRRIRDWMLRDDISFQRYAPRLLKVLARELDAPLYDALMEWVESRSDQKIKMVADILHDFNAGERFYLLCREVIQRTNHEATLNVLQAAIETTPMEGVSGVLSNFHKRRLEEISPWR